MNQIITCSIPLIECKVTFDHMGQVIMGNADCFHEPDQHLTSCPSDSKCISSMSAQMSLLGSINYAFTRSCVPSTTVNGNTCNEQSSSDMLKNSGSLHSLLFT